MTATVVRVRSAAELFDGLDSPDLGLHLAMLGAVARDPVRALRFGRHEGHDVIDKLLALRDRAGTDQHRAAIFDVLSRFDDPRVVHECRRALAIPASIAVRRIAAATLVRQAPEQAVRFLTPWLLQDRDHGLATVVADALRQHPPTGSRERIRLAVAASQVSQDEIPPFAADTAEFWLAELQGFFRDVARQRLMILGNSAFEGLRRHWDDLDPPSQAWLLEWGVAAWPVDAVELLRRALASEGPVLRAALTQIPRLGPAGQLFVPLLGRFRDHTDPTVVRLAVEAGLDGLDWRAIIAARADRHLVRLAIDRLARSEGPAACDELVALLGDSDWRMRSVAAATLRTLGVDAAERARPLLSHPDLGVRAAAAQVVSVTHS